MHLELRLWLGGGELKVGPDVYKRQGYSCNPTPEGGVSSTSYPGYTCVQEIN